MEAKYYTPSIEEFHVGLEFEVGIDREVWYDFLWGAFYGKCYTDLREIKQLIDNKALRVKYLDREDIEECGFKFLETNGMREWYIKESLNTPIPSSPDQKYWEVSLIHDSKLNTLNVLSRTSNNEIETFFEGTINNKSEFKKLMKQLNINEQKPLLENNP